MDSTEINAYVNRILSVAGDPTQVQNVQVETIAATLSGQSLILDPTSPFAQVMGCVALNTNALWAQQISNHRGLYPSSASSFSDLYKHAADEDLFDLVSTPAVGTFLLGFNWSNLINGAVKESNSDAKRIVIPRYMIISNGVDKFRLPYPIVMRILPDRTIQVFYDLSEPSPIWKPRNSFIPSKIVQISNQKYLTFSFEAPQVDILSTEVTVNKGSGGFRKKISYNGRFHYCRAFVKNANSSVWTEMKVAMSNFVYDASKPTLLLNLFASSITAELPLIYSTNGSVNDKVRIDVYTTRGEVDYLQDGISSQAYTFDFPTIEVTADNKFSAPLARFDGLIISGRGAVSGGSNGLSLQGFKDKILNRKRDTFTPDLGFDVSLVKDTISDRKYLATQKIPALLNSTTAVVSNGMGVALCTVNHTLSTLSQVYGINDHQRRITITPKCLWSRVNGQLYPVAESEVNRLLSRDQTLDSIATEGNNKEYLFSPYYYRVSSEGQRTSVDAYDFSNPRVLYKSAVGYNEFVTLMASTGDSELRGFDDKICLYLALETDQTLRASDARDIKIQLSCIPESGGRRVYFNAELYAGFDPETFATTDTLLYRVDLTTGYDVDLNHLLIVGDLRIGVALEKDWDLCVFIKTQVIDYSDPFASYYSPTQVQGFVDGEQFVGLTRETITLKLGTWLEHLWQRFRSIPESTEYLTYENDVPAVYTTNVIERDAQGSIVYVTDGNGDKRPSILHRKGDPVLQDGLPVVLHPAGSVVRDNLGYPVAKEGVRGIVRSFDMVMFDGRFYIADGDDSELYLQRSRDLLTSWIVDSGPDLAVRQYELTSTYILPKVGMESLTVRVDDGSTVLVESAQKIFVDIYLTSNGFKNLDLRDTIVSQLPAIIVKEISQTTVSRVAIESAIKSAVSSDVLGVRVGGLFGDTFSVVTVEDPTKSFSIASRLAVRSNKTIGVEDWIDVNFHDHG